MSDRTDPVIENGSGSSTSGTTARSRDRGAGDCTKGTGSGVRPARRCVRGIGARASARRAQGREFVRRARAFAVPILVPLHWLAVPRTCPSRGEHVAVVRACVHRALARRPARRCSRRGSGRHCLRPYALGQAHCLADLARLLRERRAQAVRARRDPHTAEVEAIGATADDDRGRGRDVPVAVQAYRFAQVLELDRRQFVDGTLAPQPQREVRGARSVPRVACVAVPLAVVQVREPGENRWVDIHRGGETLSVEPDAAPVRQPVDAARVVESQLQVEDGECRAHDRSGRVPPCHGRCPRERPVKC